MLSINMRKFSVTTAGHSKRGLLLIHLVAV